MDDGKNQKWMTLLRDYMIDNHINHTFWCLNPNSGDTGGLLDSSFKKWDDETYGLFETSLWQTSESGKYIGLDHQIPLGVNGTGLSLTEFYDSYASTEGSNLDGGTKGNNPVKPTTQAKTKAAESTKASETTKTSATTTNIIYGDANCDGNVDISDAVLVKCYLINSEKHKMSEQSKLNSDVHGSSNGVNSQDAVTIQKYVLGSIKTLPV